MLLASFIPAKATVFTLVVATVDTAYAHYLLAVAAVDSDQVHITALGAKPVAPTAAVANTDWNNYVTSLNTYISSMATLQATLATDIIAQRTAELAVLTALGYNTGDTNICSDQWVKVQGGSFTTAWIGFSSQSTYLKVTLSNPTQAFPYY